MMDLVPAAILAAPFILGPLTFVAPAMLWGALAAAGPVLIHLILRTKPQPVPLPTIQFVLKTHQQTQARQKLKHLLLLMMRILAILLLVAVLAQPSIETTAAPTAARPPVEAVFCMDDSASMDYRSQGRSRFEQARERAARLLRDRGRFPSGSRVALLTGSASGGAPRLTLDINYVRQQVEQLEVGQHDRSVAGMLERAYALLAEGTLQTREIYLFGDLTRQSWRDLPTGAFADRRLVQVFCVDAGDASNSNFALLDPGLPDGSVPAGAPIRIRFGVQAGQASGQRQVEAVVDGKVRWRQGQIDIPHLATVQQTAELTGLEPGLHQGELRLQPDDPLEIDNTRYFTIHVGSPPKVAIVGPPQSEALAAVSAMLAPDSLPIERRRIALTPMAPVRLDGLENPASYAAILLVDVPSLTQHTFGRIEAYVARGGLLVLIPGPEIDPAGYREGRGVLAAIPAGVVIPTKATHVAPLDKPHALLARFQDGSGLSLSEPAIYRYMRYGDLLGGAQVLARLEDGSPAIAVRRIGRGDSLALAFSPVREWGEWAIDAGPLLVLLNTAITGSPARTSPVGNFRIAQTARLAAPQPRNPTRSRDHRVVTIWLPGHRQSVSAVVDPNTSTVKAITDRCGHYRVSSEESDESAGPAYSVNTPADESQLDRLSSSQIEARFPAGQARVVKDVDELKLTGSSGGGTWSLTGWLALALLGLLLAEGFFSNRFYRQREGDRDSAAGPIGAVERE
jgi:hypothetical protein